MVSLNGVGNETSETSWLKAVREDVFWLFFHSLLITVGNVLLLFFSCGLFSLDVIVLLIRIGLLFILTLVLNLSVKLLSCCFYQWLAVDFLD